MFQVIKFNGDVRKNIADSASAEYEGLLQMASVEYLPAVDVTLLYCFNMEAKHIHELFPVGDWFWENAIIPAWAEKPLYGAVDKDFYYHANSMRPADGTTSRGSMTSQILKIINDQASDTLVSRPDDYYLSNYPSPEGVKLFDNLNSLLDYRDIVTTLTTSKGTHERKVKKFSIRLIKEMGSGPEDFDSLDELKELLKTRYNARRLIPISLAPWGDRDLKLNYAREVDEVTLLYLYEFQFFQPRY